MRFETRSGQPSEGTNDVTEYQSAVFIRRWGEAIFFGRCEGFEVTRVEIEPDHKLVLDVNYTNNSWISEPKASKAAMKWAYKWTIWLQSLMEFFAIFS
ncbi:hypothetical protein MJD09_06695 [bacterium]|nr:hypothetical protein [bacterium]